MNFKDGLKDEIKTGGAGRKSEKAAKKAIDVWRKLDPPKFEEFDPEKFEYAGDYEATQIDAGADIDPRLANVERVDRSSFEDISLDPRLRDNQMNSLSALDGIIQGGGMNAADQANLSKIQSQANQADKGRRDAIMQGMAQRGMGGSGMELLQQLSSSQAANNQQNQAGLDVAGMSQQRALDAIMNSGQLSGDMRSQDWSQKAQAAQAADAIKTFNAQNQTDMNRFNTTGVNDMARYNRDTGIGVQQYNAGATDTAGMYSNNARQNNMNMNTGARNEAQMQNKFVAPQQSFQNSMGKVQGYSDQLSGESARQAKVKKDKDEDVSKKVGTVFSMFSDRRTKENIKDVSKEDLKEFFTAIDPKFYTYINDDHEMAAKGERIGFMLQDVQNTKLGKLITKKGDDGLLSYDKDNLYGIILAGLAMGVV